MKSRETANGCEGEDFFATEEHGKSREVGSGGQRQITQVAWGGIEPRKTRKTRKRRGGGGAEAVGFQFSVFCGQWVVGGVVIVVARGRCWGENTVSG
jgi:hypothetical protein